MPLTRSQKAAKEIAEEYDRTWERTIGAVSQAQVESIALAIIRRHFAVQDRRMDEIDQCYEVVDQRQRMMGDFGKG